jgi:hypothetical protein
VFTPFHKPPYTYPYGRSVDETTTVEAMESMEMAPGALPHAGKVPEQRLLSLKLVFDGGGLVELFWEKRRLI